MILDRFELSKRIMQNPPLIENLIDPEVQLQPNGVDLTLREVYVFKSPGRIDYLFKGLAYFALGSATIYSAARTAARKIRELEQ